MNYKEKTVTDMSKMSQDLTFEIAENRQKSNDLEQQIQRLMSQLAGHSGALSKNDAEIQYCNHQLNELRQFAEKVELEALKLQEYRLDQEQLEQRLDKLKIQIEDSMNYNLGLHNFVEKYMPVRIQGIIGDTLRSVLGPRERKMLSEYEKSVLKKQVVVITGDTGLADLASQEEALRNEIGAKINVDMSNSAASKYEEEQAKRRSDTA